jgi:hypothetical protein
MSAPLHIVFGPSGAGVLKQALKKAGLKDRVVADFDDLSFGPINPADDEIRRAWAKDTLGLEDYFAMPFWEEALAAERPVVWTSRRVAREYAGFLEFMDRVGDRIVDVIDLTDVMIRTADQGRVHAVMGLLVEDEILANRLLDQARPLEPEDREASQALWRRLRAENAPLRVIDENELRSAPLSHFDQSLLSHAAGDWRSWAYLVGGCLAESVETALYPVGDLVLASRVQALVEAGALEGRGSLANRPFEVRLPSR